MTSSQLEHLKDMHCIQEEQVMYIQNKNGNLLSMIFSESNFQDHLIDAINTLE